MYLIVLEVLEVLNKCLEELLGLFEDMDSSFEVKDIDDVGAIFKAFSFDHEVCNGVDLSHVDVLEVVVRG
jgi:hypothetical protein